MDLGELVVTVELRSRGNTSEVAITHEGLRGEQMVKFHSYGWERALETLAADAGFPPG